MPTPTPGVWNHLKLLNFLNSKSSLLCQCKETPLQTLVREPTLKNKILWSDSDFYPQNCPISVKNFLSRIPSELHSIWKKRNQSQLSDQVSDLTRNLLIWRKETSLNDQTKIFYQSCPISVEKQQNFLSRIPHEISTIRKNLSDLTRFLPIWQKTKNDLNHINLQWNQKNKKITNEIHTIWKTTPQFQWSDQISERIWPI